MSLSNIVISRRTVPVPGNPDGFSVRGLSTHDLDILLQRYPQQVLAAVDLFENSKDDTSAFVMNLMQVLPDVLVAAIVLAADEPGTEPIVRTLPAGVQMHAALEVIDATLDGGSLPFITGRLRALNAGGPAAPESATR